VTVPASPRVLVAGIGDVFLGDDGFGVEVVRRLRDDRFPDGVTVADFGIAGVQLAYELLAGYDVLILVDALARGGAPGTVYVFEPAEPADEIRMDAAMTPDAVLAMAHSLGGAVDRVVVVGCEPSDVDERTGLSAPVKSALDGAVDAVREVVHSHVR